MMTAIGILSGCSLAHRSHRVVKEEIPQTEVQAGKGNAYLFDVKIWRQGRKNSVRLDLYQLGDTLSFFARGYLGKGVMKGLLLKDSMIVYFPGDDEYYSGKIADLIDNPCLNDSGIEGLILQLFRGVPLPGSSAEGPFEITALNQDSDDQKFLLKSANCHEGIEIEYDTDHGRFIMKSIQFKVTDKSFQFEAERRTVKLDVDIPPEKLNLIIPETATRITP